MTDGIADMIGEIKTARVEVDIDADPEDFEIVNSSTEETFDPSYHVSDKDGNPVLTKTGKFRKKPGRNSAGKSGTGGLNYPEPPAPDNVGLAAETAAAIYINSGVVIFGPEWLPDGHGEKEGLVDAFRAYLDAKGIDDIPPGLALSIAMMGYAAKRLYMPETQTRLSRIILWVKLKAGMVKYNASRNDTRSDRMRENDTGENHGEKRGWFRRARSDS